MRKLILATLTLVFVSLSMAQIDGQIVGVEDPSSFHSLEEPPVVSSESQMTLDRVEKSGIGKFRAQNMSEGIIEYHFAYYSNDSSWIIRIGRAPHTTAELGTIDFTDSSSGYIEYTNENSVNLSQDRMLIPNQSIVNFDEEESRYNGENLIGEQIEENRDGLINASLRKYDLYVNSGGEFERSHVRWVNSDTDVIPETQLEPVSKEELTQKLESKNERIEKLEKRISNLENQIEVLQSKKQNSGTSQGIGELLDLLISIF